MIDNDLYKGCLYKKTAFFVLFNKKIWNFEK